MNLVEIMMDTSPKVCSQLRYSRKVIC